MVCARVGENAIRSKQRIWSAPEERCGEGALDSNLKIDLATNLSIITNALRVIAVSKVKSIDVALIEDERSTKTHLVISHFNFSNAPGRHFFIAAL